MFPISDTGELKSGEKHRCQNPECDPKIRQEVKIKFDYFGV